MTPIDDTLKNLIYKQIDETKQIIREILENDPKNSEVIPTQRIYRKTKVYSFNYTEKGINYTTSSDFESEFDYSSGINAISQIIAVGLTDHWKKIIDYMDENFPNNEYRMQISNRFLFDICLSVFKEIYEGFELDSEKISLKINILHKNLINSPINYFIQAKLDGLYIYPSNSINVAFKEIDFIIRQVTKKDLEDKLPIEFTTIKKFKPPSAILEINIQTKELLDGKTINNIIDQSLCILRLYKPCSVKVISYSVSSENFLFNPFSSTPHFDISTPITVTLTEEDEVRLKTLWDLIPNKISDPCLMKSDNVSKSLKIALQRYTESLIRRFDFDARISNLIMGLEAIFLAESMELSFRLKNRIAKMITKYNGSPLQIRDLISDSYKIRSSFVHGDGSKKVIKKYKNPDKEIFQQLVHILHISILSQLFLNIQKKDLLNLLDDSLIDSQKDKELETIIEKLPNIIIDILKH